MTDQTTIVSNPGYTAVAFALVRGVIQIASGFGFTWALTVSADQTTMIASGLAMLATIGWSAWEKIAAARKMAALAARSQQPTQVNTP